MAIVLARNWWALALRGLLAMLFGVLTFFWPRISLVSLVLLFGSFMLVDGLLAVITAFRAAEGARWWALLLSGLVGIAMGALTLIWPGITALILLYLVAGWAIGRGIFEILGAIRLRKQITGEWLWVLSGITTVLFGVLLVIWPRVGALVVIWLVGAFAFISGGMLLGLAFRLRSWGRTVNQAPGRHSSSSPPQTTGLNHAGEHG